MNKILVMWSIALVIIAVLIATGLLGCTAVDDFNAFQQLKLDGGLKLEYDSGEVLDGSEVADLGRNDLIKEINDAVAIDFTTTDTLQTDDIFKPLTDMSESTSDLASYCIASLSNIGNGDFTISFDVTAMPEPDRYQPFIDQRSSCGIDQDFWAIGMAPNGTVLAQTNDSSGTISIYSTIIVNDGLKHNIVLKRVVSLLSLSIDGFVNASASSTSKLDALAMLEIGFASYCDLGIAQGVIIDGVCLSNK